MAKLYFKYGTMESGKSTKIIQEAYNYDRNNKSIIVRIMFKINDRLTSIPAIILSPTFFKHIILDVFYFIKKR
mgnify:CR=1 FL=1